MTLRTRVLRKAKLHTILLNGLLGLAILWGPTASADPVDGTADLVFEQPNFTSITANNGGVSANSLSAPDGVTLDVDGNVYVANTNNNRVPVYLDPRNTDTVADPIPSQPDFVSITCNDGGNSLCAPDEVAIDAPGNVLMYMWQIL